MTVACWILVGQAGPQGSCEGNISFMYYHLEAQVEKTWSPRVVLQNPYGCFIPLLDLTYNWDIATFVCITLTKSNHMVNHNFNGIGKISLHSNGKS